MAREAATRSFLPLRVHVSVPLILRGRFSGISADNSSGYNFVIGLFVRPVLARIAAVRTKTPPPLIKFSMMANF